MEDVLNALKDIGGRRDEMLSLLMGLPGNVAPDVIKSLRAGLEDIGEDLEEVIELVEHYSEEGGADSGCDCCDGPDEELLPVEHAKGLAEWARQEDPRKVSRALEAIRGGHVSDLSLIL